ncbi:MAG: periplasmic heavy metal sensor [Pseudomonadota bacterium]
MTNMTTKSPVWVRVLLVGSLAMNFVLIGVASGIAYNFAKSGGRGHTEMAQILGPIASSLPKDTRKHLRRAIVSRRAEFFQIRAQINLTDDAVLEAMAADPFDPSALESALDARRDALTTAISALNGPILDVFSGLSAQERVELAQNIRSKRKPRVPFGNHRSVDQEDAN